MVQFTILREGKELIVPIVIDGIEWVYGRDFGESWDLKGRAGVGRISFPIACRIFSYNSTKRTGTLTHG
ncbi:MAG: hypothetical protein A3D65_03340 [Candidatus Lloydbacteria bacterium RIFCSPHIGHO2_02_FULL_50_13]|uniref:Uncharacterized protein n=1 Tax=Candidatus Lloydbacteria bacterium RIFCSPHIGHO2_02_FULL_50_13 TaxID=1798661 RepID=A0A1G2D9C4_9BACT|nr:MAG: hypothetical protein A3D65_03340 [Candidatus Lloydbacteria bacterium RIFCSPHIGHO2_02_FULL_50_13]